MEKIINKIKDINIFFNCINNLPIYIKNYSKIKKIKFIYNKEDKEIIEILFKNINYKNRLSKRKFYKKIEEMCLINENSLLENAIELSSCLENNKLLKMNFNGFIFHNLDYKNNK